MWFWIWAVLLLAALVVVAVLGWRLFVAVKALLATLGQTSAATHEAGIAAERAQQEWLNDRAAADATYHDELAEHARPAPSPLALLLDGEPRPDPDARREALP